MGNNTREQDRQDELWLRNYNMQKQFSQEGIRWKVEDAKRSGIHPLYALGAQTNAASPIFVGGSSGGSSGGGTSVMSGQAMRPRDTKSPEEKQMAQLQIQGQRIRNEMDLERLKQLRQAGQNVNDPYIKPPGIMEDPYGWSIGTAGNWGRHVAVAGRFRS